MPKDSNSVYQSKDKTLSTKVRASDYKAISKKCGRGITVSTYLYDLIQKDLSQGADEKAALVDGTAKLLRESRALSTKSDAIYHIFVSFVRLYLAHTPEISADLRPSAGALADSRLERFLAKAAKDMANDPAIIANLLDYVSQPTEEDTGDSY